MKRTVTAEELARPLMSYTEAVEQICSFFSALTPVDVELSGGLGLVCAESVVAEYDVPGFANSAMDLSLIHI